MGETRKITRQIDPEGDKPQETWGLHRAEGGNRRAEAEVLLRRLNEDFSIVTCEAKRVVGVRMVCPPLARLNSIDIVRRCILEGTCELLEKLVGNQNPGQFVAVMCEVKTGIDFTYVIGVEVSHAVILPEVLPPNTASVTLPAAVFARRERKHGERANNALSSFSDTNFRKGFNYVYSDASFPFSYYNGEGEMLRTYQPVKQPCSESEAYDSVSYEVVALPEIKIIAKSGDGMDCMFRFFKEMDKAEQTETAKLHLGNLVAFGGKNVKGEKGAYFGSRVTRFDRTPEGFDEAVYPSKTFVRMYQKQTNNDNASIVFDGGKSYFFTTHPEYVTDYADGFSDLFIFQYEQGVEVFVPIRRREDDIR